MARTNGNGSTAKSKSPSAKKLSPERKIELRAYEIYLSATALPATPSKTGCAPNAKFSRRAAKPPRKPPPQPDLR